MKKLDLDNYYTVMSTEGVANYSQGFRCDGARPVRRYKCGNGWMTLREYGRYVRRRQIFYSIVVCASAVAATAAVAAALFLL